MDISQLRQKICLLSRERWNLEKELLEVLSRKQLLRGSFVKGFRACNKGGCKCTKGELHGPFWYLSTKVAGKIKMIFIKECYHMEVEKLAGNYRRWRSIRARMVKINLEIIGLIDQMEKTIIVEIKDVEKNGKRAKAKKVKEGRKEGKK